MKDTILVFTSREIGQMKQHGGSKAWAIDATRARGCRYLVCTWNQNGFARDTIQEYAHRAAFLVAPIDNVEYCSDPDEAGRVVIRFSRFARISIPDVWPKQQNPVSYTTLADLGIDFDTLTFEPLEPRSVTEPNESPSSKSSTTQSSARVSMNLNAETPATVIVSQSPPPARAAITIEPSKSNLRRKMKSPDVISREKQHKEASASMIARFALQNEAGLHPSHFNELLSLACWKFTEAGGDKYGTRYITRAAMEHDAKRRHEHVIPRLTLRSAMRTNRDRAEKFLSLAIACIVTHEEHQRLNERAFGWHRYRDLGIEVIDTESGAPANLEALARELDVAWQSLGAIDGGES